MSVPTNERMALYRERKECDAQIQHLRHPQGKLYSEAENRQAILTFLSLKRENLRGNQDRKSQAQLIRDVSLTLCRGQRLLFTVINHYLKTSEVYVATGGPRGHFELFLSDPFFACVTECS